MIVEVAFIIHTYQIPARQRWCDVFVCARAGGGGGGEGGGGDGLGVGVGVCGYFARLSVCDWSSGRRGTVWVWVWVCVGMLPVSLFVTGRRGGIYHTDPSSSGIAALVCVSALFHNQLLSVSKLYATTLTWDHFFCFDWIAAKHSLLLLVVQFSVVT